MTNAYPLQWPAHVPRTRYPQYSRFQLTLNHACVELEEEVARLGGAHLVISTNMETRRDGVPRAGQREPDDSGVAVYFLLDGRQKVFCCDKWDRVKDNIRAISKTIEALRGIERWGSSAMREQAFAGFDALPPPKHWSEVLGVTPAADRASIDRAWRERAKRFHPDNGGSHAAMAEINAARDRALAERAAG